MRSKYKTLVLMAFLIAILSSGCVQEETETTTTTTTSTTPQTTIAPPTTSTVPATTSTNETTTTTTSVAIPGPRVEMSISTDRELYHSNEIMTINVTIDSPGEIPGADVRVYGINARYYRLDKTEKTNIDTGENTVVISYTTPSCTGCAGISPGTYQLNADLTYGGNVIASATRDVEIRQ
jgi:hypothetical protein